VGDVPWELGPDRYAFSHHLEGGSADEGEEPVGYKVSVIAFANGEPVAASTNQTAAVDVFANMDNSKCPGGCFRYVVKRERGRRLLLSLRPLYLFLPSRFPVLSSTYHPAQPPLL
jgi:hypothetical protein